MAVAAAAVRIAKQVKIRSKIVLNIFPPRKDKTPEYFGRRSNPGICARLLETRHLHVWLRPSDVGPVLMSAISPYLVIAYFLSLYINPIYGAPLAHPE